MTEAYAELAQFRWAVRYSNLGPERVLQQARYRAETDEIEWFNVPEVLFPTEAFEPKK